LSHPENFTTVKPVYLSNDGGLSWRTTGINNIRTITFSQNKFFAARTQQLLQGTQLADSLLWQELPNVDGYIRDILVLQSNSCGLWASGDAQGRSNIILFSTNEGKSFRFVDFNVLSYKSVSITLTERTVYANLLPTGIFRSNDCGTTWDKIPNTDSLALANAYDDGFLIAGVIVNSSRVRYFRSKNNGTSWQEFTIPDSGFTTSFVRHGNSFYARCINIFSRTPQNQVSYVYRSDDSCRTWQRDSEGLPASRANSLVLFQNALYCGTEQGMYRAVITPT
jgi:hypothetical protein